MTGVTGTRLDFSVKCSVFIKGQFLMKIPLTKDANGLQRYAIIIEEMTSCTALTMHPGMKETF